MTNPDDVKSKVTDTAADLKDKANEVVETVKDAVSGVADKHADKVTDSVKAATAFVDDKTGEDITRHILLQVIAEQEHAGEPVMSRDFLSQVIRTYGGYPEGMAFAVLLMNSMTPIIDTYFKPRIYGRDRKGNPLQTKN